MIIILAGENSYEVAQALRQIEVQFTGEAERLDGQDIEPRQLPDILMGGTLFSDKRLVIIKGLSDNKTSWSDLERWVDKVSDDVDVVFIEPKLDKRTKTYKALKKIATIRDFPAWTERDDGKAMQWLEQEAAKRAVTIDRKSVQQVVSRVGVDQWRLLDALEKLSVLDNINEESIKEHIATSPAENVFNLFESALRGQSETVHRMIQTLEQTDDPYMVFGLLSGQVFQLAALSVSDQPSAVVAKDIGAHPFALGKLSSHASRLSRKDIRVILDAFAEADTAMKTTAGDSWLLIERALLKTAAINS